MRTKKILTVLALLCAVVQGAWAQDKPFTPTGRRRPPKIGCIKRKTQINLVFHLICTIFAASTSKRKKT